MELKNDSRIKTVWLPGSLIIWSNLIKIVLKQIFFFSCMYLQFMSLKNFNFPRTDVLKLIKLILHLMFTLGSEVMFSVN